MRFAEPLAFLALILVPLVLVGHVLNERRLARRVQRAGDPDLIHAMTSTGADHGRGQRFASAILIAISLALICVALARPQFGLRTEIRKGRGMDLVVALDLSRSMLARDVAPSRLERARAELNDLIDQLPGDRVGLVGFTSVAIPLCPLTVDHSALSLQLSAANPAEMPAGGTSIAEAIAAARRMLDSSPKDGGSKAILIITDGEEHVGDAARAARDAREADVEVHVAGVGSRTGEPIPLISAGGAVEGYLKDRAGKTVITRLDEASLQAVASAGGGLSALPAPAGGMELGAIRAHLAQLKKAELEERTVRVYEERYRWLLAPAFVLLLLATLWKPRRRRRRGWGASSVAMALSFLLMGAGPLERPDPDVEAGNTALQDGRGEEAVTSYDKARGRLGGDPRLLFNRGLAQAAAGEIDDAIQDFESALAQAAEPGLRSQTNLALGNAYRAKKKLAEAITAYRQAVIADPANSAARRNLELSRAMKRIQDLQPKQENPDGEPNDDPNQDRPDAGPQDAGPQDGNVGDGGGQQNQDQSGADGGVSDGPPPPPETKDGGSDGQDGGASSPPEGGDGGAPDAQGSGAEEQPAEALDQQDVDALLDALREQEKVLKRKKLIEKYGKKSVEKDW